MTTPSASYEKVFYDLRPAKQIERRMIMDVLQLLAEGGIRIRDYQYTGLGSIYFVDFILFHRLLGITRLWSAENDASITKRIRFNRPFAFVELFMEPVGTVIPRLSPELKHVLWLDYDARLTRPMIEDVVAAGHHLSAGSLLLVTVDVKPPDDDGPASWRKYYEREAGDYLPFDVTDQSFHKSRLAHTHAQILFNAIRQGVAGREQVRFIPLFNFAYADGHPMLTVGGMIGTQLEEDGIAKCNLRRLEFLRLSAFEEPWNINVTRLTRRERIYLDSHMPCVDGWAPGAFELSQSDAADYRSVYRYYPTFAELFT